jgi:hypothetical protein
VRFSAEDARRFLLARQLLAPARAVPAAATACSMCPQAAETRGDGVLVVLEPGERHGIRALVQSRLLLRLSPRPGADRYEAAGADPHKLPRNATEPQLEA